MKIKSSNNKLPDIKQCDNKNAYNKEPNNKQHKQPKGRRKMYTVALL